MTLVSVPIDPWRDSDGDWQWHQWFSQGQIDSSVCDLPPRKLLAKLREAGFLDAGTAGRVFIVDDGYHKVVCWRTNGRPLLAVAYGEASE